MLKKIINKLFFNPYKFVKKSNNINTDSSTILLKSCTFRFDKVQNIINIGENSMIGCNFIFESDSGEINIGCNTFINAGTSLLSRTKISIGSNVTIAWGCTIYDHNSHSLNYRERQKDIQRQNNDYKNKVNFLKSKNWDVVKSNPIDIKDNVWIGFDSVILSGVTIGEGAIVGANTVVRQDVEPWTVVIGNPAIVVKRLKSE